MTVILGWRHYSSHITSPYEIRFRRDQIRHRNSSLARPGEEISGPRQLAQRLANRQQRRPLRRDMVFDVSQPFRFILADAIAGAAGRRIYDADIHHSA